jgi:hypothetical protein
MEFLGVNMGFSSIGAFPATSAVGANSPDSESSAENIRLIHFSQESMLF